VHALCFDAKRPCRLGYLAETRPFSRDRETATPKALPRIGSRLLATGAMPALVLSVDDCRAAYERLRARGVELTQEPVERYGNVDAGFRDLSGNGWKMIQARG
jgi:Glyoxalase/Bleomycin resistance protein/Dioxygenase superfamily